MKKHLSQLSLSTAPLDRDITSSLSQIPFHSSIPSLSAHHLTGNSKDNLRPNSTDDEDSSELSDEEDEIEDDEDIDEEVDVEEEQEEDEDSEAISTYIEDTDEAGQQQATSSST